MESTLMAWVVRIAAALGGAALGVGLGLRAPPHTARLRRAPQAADSGLNARRRRAVRL